MGLRVLGCKGLVSGLRIGVLGPGLGFRAWGVRIGVLGLGCRVSVEDDK